MTFKEKRARKLLVKSGWIADYNYVFKVMMSCVHTNDKGKATIQLCDAFLWGLKCLENKLNMLRHKHPRLGFALIFECKRHVDKLFDIKWKIQDKMNYETVQLRGIPQKP